MVVLRQEGDDWTDDFVCQRRLGDEQAVLYWGEAKRRFVIGDVWKEKPCQ